jgi:hypothetical protein
MECNFDSAHAVAVGKIPEDGGAAENVDADAIGGRRRHRHDGILPCSIGYSMRQPSVALISPLIPRGKRRMTRMTQPAPGDR